MPIRINPSEITGTITATGVTNGVGPYRFRGGRSIESVRVSAQGLANGDILTLVFVEPGQTPSATLDETPLVSNYTTTNCVVPFSIIPDAHQIGGQFDLYVLGTTVASTNSVKIQKVL